jgi:hypothetical protein
MPKYSIHIISNLVPPSPRIVDRSVLVQQCFIISCPVQLKSELTDTCNLYVLGGYFLHTDFIPNCKGAQCVHTFLESTEKKHWL